MVTYSIHMNGNAYQYFLPADQEVSIRGDLCFDCQPQKRIWKPPEVYIEKPKLKKGNFLSLGAGSSGFACDETTRENQKMSELMEMSGELLPLPHEGKMFHVLNVLECVNCLDRDKSEWAPEMQGKIGMPRSYVFHRSRVPETPLFKIPETSRSQILCASGDGVDPEYDFKKVYERMGLTGLFFRKLWSDE